MTFLGNQNNFKVEFTGEAEVYGPEAYRSGRIPRYAHGPVSISVQNTGLTAVTIAPGARGTVIDSGIVDEIAVAFAGIVLEPGDADGLYGGRVIFDTGANGVSLDLIRAVVHGGGDGQLSICIL